MSGGGNQLYLMVKRMDDHILTSLWYMRWHSAYGDDRRARIGVIKRIRQRVFELRIMRGKR